MAHEVLVFEIKALTARLKRGEVKFLDVLHATEVRLKVADGSVHYDADPEVVEALSGLSEAIARVWMRDANEIVTGITATIGDGVGAGRYGPTFFRQIRSK